LALSACDQEDATAPSTPSDDGRLLLELVALNQQEVDDGNLAASRGSDGSVRELAGRMADEHSQSLARLLTLATRGTISGGGGDGTPPLVVEGATVAMQLAGATGTSFDVTYVCSRIRAQSELLQLLALPPQNAKLAAEVDLERVTAMEDLSAAQGVAQSLPAPGADGGADGGVVLDGGGSCASYDGH
jgi:predicted outer membrane protein